MREHKEGSSRATHSKSHIDVRSSYRPCAFFDIAPELPNLVVLGRDGLSFSAPRTSHYAVSSSPYQITNRPIP
jgi:hypothetical protein